jgi:methyl-accepting chemotaxis protein
MAEGTAAAAGGPASPARRRYLVDRGLQLRAAALLAGAGAVLSLLCGLWLHQAHVAATELLPLDAESRLLVDQTDRDLLLVLVGITLLMAVALGFLGILLTHRVAGPLFVLGRSMRTLAEGRFPRVRALRRGDELRHLYGSVTEAIATLRHREERLVDRLDEAVAQLSLAVPRAPEIRPVVAALAETARERREALEGGAAPPPATP